jgi:outer membrane protein
MTSKLVHYFMAVACALSLTALAQTSSAAPGLPAAPSSTGAAASVPAGTKIATIALEPAVGATNEGQRDLEALYKKLQPKQAELKASNDELDSLKKQLQTQGDKLNDESRAALVRQIDQKQKALDRSMQDFREDAGGQQQEIEQRILQKMAPVIQKYVRDNGYGLLIDNSKQWPEGPIIMTSDAFDITKPVVEAYNAQSGVPAPVQQAPAAKPAGTRPAGSATKPLTPPAK